MNPPSDDLVDLQIKLSYAERRIDALNDALVEQSAVVADLVERLDASDRVVRALLAQLGVGAEVLGAMPEDDPVPSSG